MPLVTPLANRFLPALVATVEEMAEQDYFASRAGDKCQRCGKPYFWTATRIKRALTAETGPVTWPLGPNDRMPDDRVIMLVEAIFRIVARPRDVKVGRACGISHAEEFDITKGRYDYTIKVNDLFERFKTGLRLDRGTVRQQRSAVLSPRVADELAFGGDVHLRTLVCDAVNAFNSGQLAGRSRGVTLLAQALERVKSMSNPTNKAVSARMLVAEMSPDPKLNAAFDAILRSTTEISNNTTIRHHEVGKIEIAEDSDLIEFLFYHYYDLIRFGLTRISVRGQELPAVAS